MHSKVISNWNGFLKWLGLSSTTTLQTWTWAKGWSKSRRSEEENLRTKKSPWPWPQVGPRLSAGPLKVRFSIGWHNVYCFGHNAHWKRSRFKYWCIQVASVRPQILNTVELFVTCMVSFVQKVLSSPTSEINFLGHISLKISMILSLWDPTRCFRKLTWHFLKQEYYQWLWLGQYCWLDQECKLDQECWLHQEVIPWEWRVADVANEE